MNERISTILKKEYNIFSNMEKFMNEQKFTCILHIQRIPRVRISSFNQRLKLIDALSIMYQLTREKEICCNDRNYPQVDCTYTSVVPRATVCITLPMMQPKMIDCPGRSRAWHFASRDPSHGPPGRRPRGVRA